MKIKLLITIFLSLLPLSADTYAQMESINVSNQKQGNISQTIYIIPVRGTIDLGLASFIKRSLEEAKTNNAQAVIFEIDTFGGRVDAAVDITRYIDEVKTIPTVAYIIDQAWSAGALIALACKSIIMSPGSSIGSAEPRIGGGLFQQEITDEKTISALRAKFKSTAEENNHPANLAQAMVDKDIELKKVRIKNEVKILTPEELEEIKIQHRDKDIKIEKTLVQKDKLLNLTAKEAEELNLADTILSTREEVLNYLTPGDRKIVETSPNWAEGLVRFLTHPIVSSILLTLGFLGIIFELKIPGWGISGTIGLLCLSLFFWGHYLVGLANWLEVFLFLLGIMLLALEIFVIPGFGVAGISGIVLIIASIFFALIKHPLHVPKEEFFQAFYIISYAFIATFIVILLTLKFIPHLGLWKRLVLFHEEKSKYGFQIPSMVSESYMGIKGKALTNLRPSGRGKFGKDILDVITEGGFIENGKDIEIIKIEGNRIIVKESTNA